LRDLPLLGELLARVTGDSVEYRPYQVVAGNYPDISLDEFRRSIQFISPDGEVCSGAKAVYVLLKDRLPYNFYPALSLSSGFRFACRMGLYIFFQTPRVTELYQSCVVGKKT